MSETPGKQEPRTNNCPYTDDDVCNYAMDLAESAEDPVMKRHIQDCPQCQAVLADFLRVADTGKELKSATAPAKRDPRSSKLAMEKTLNQLKQIGDFEIIKKLGQGGMGSVFLARQRSLDRQVALKVIAPALADQPDFIARFLREARATGNLNHPNIVQGIDVGEQHGIYYLAMEFVEGQSARQMVKHGPLPEKQVLQIGLAMAHALTHAHAHGIVHRDIKPDNILIDKRGTPKLCDMGLARLENKADTDQSLTQEGIAVGTPYYISPEQASGRKDLDAKTDLYSLGATLYHLLTGKPMFEGDSSVAVMARHIAEKSPNPETSGASISKSTVAILAKLLTKDRADRYASARALAADLERVLRGEQPAGAKLNSAKWPFLSGMSDDAPPRRRNTTGPATPVSANHAPRREMVAKPKSSNWIVPAVGAALIALIAAVYSTSGNPPSPTVELPSKQPPASERNSAPAPKPAIASTEEFKRSYAEAEESWMKKPEDFDSALADFERVRVASKGTEYEQKASDQITAIGKRRDEAASLLAQQLTEEARSLAAQQKFDSAMALWADIPPNQGLVLKARADKAIDELRAEGEAGLKTVLDEAERDLGAKRWVDGKSALDSAGKFEYAAGAARIKDLRDRLATGEKSAAESARNVAAAAADVAFAKHVAPFADAVIKGDLKAARKAAADCAAEPALTDLPEKSQSLTEICAALEKAEASQLAALEKLKDGREYTFELGKRTIQGVVSRVTADEIYVEVKMKGGNGVAAQPVRISELKEADRKRLMGEVKPQTAAEHLAEAIRALRAGENAVAATELAASKDCPVAPLIQTRLDEKLLAAAEVTARSAWEGIEKEAGTGKLSESKAKDLTDKLASFQKEYGKTKFAAGIADKATALQERLFGQSQQLVLDLGEGVKLELVLIRAGKFTMGSPASEPKRYDSETLHPVTLTQPFYMSKYPITQEQYALLMGKNPSTIKSANNPVDTVSWNDAQEFCARLSKKASRRVLLPTEAQWEYACRAGSTTAYYYGDSEKDLNEYCWYVDNSEDKPLAPGGKKAPFANKLTHPVGLKQPNAWGLYDMHGNVSQWCQDWFEKFSDQPAVDPIGPDQGKGHVVRGGSCNLASGDCRAAFRLAYPPERVNGHVGGFGFRVVIAKN